MYTIPDTYEQARDLFRNSLDALHQAWPDAEPGAHTLACDPNLTIDWIATSQPRPRLLVITTGEHGIEAYAGSLVLEMLTREFLPRLDPQSTGLLLVHAINPWGMKHRRRVNIRNVDLNRNFVLDEKELSPDINPDYTDLSHLLNPRQRLMGWKRSWMEFLAGITRKINRLGITRLRAAILSGQYIQPEGIYYGGTHLQEEILALSSLYRRTFSQAEHIVQLDMHTGYGPKARMTVVNSPLEKRSAAHLVKQFDYPLVAAATSEEFYPIHGDMIDFIYRLVETEFPDRRLYATSFEFGTLGDGILENLRDVHAMVTENQVFHYGAVPAASAAAQHDFEELYLPSAAAWRSAVLADARRAAAGILHAEGFLTN